MNEIIVEIVRDLLDYNPETGEFRWKFRSIARCTNELQWKAWNGRYANTVAGYKSPQGYQEITIFDKSYYAHRLAWLHYYGEWPKNELDHRNQVKTDNGIENLREVTSSQNKMNGSDRIWGTSKYKGVYWSKKANKWVAQIRLDGKPKYLGSFLIEEDAARTYDRAALKYFGEFANLNFSE